MWNGISDRKPPGVGRGRGRGREDVASGGRPSKGIGRGLEDGSSKGMGGGRGGRGGPGGRTGGNRGTYNLSIFCPPFPLEMDISTHFHVFWCLIGNYENKLLAIQLPRTHFAQPLRHKQEYVVIIGEHVRGSFMVLFFIFYFWFGYINE